jgi:hypothetical protein
MSVMLASGPESRDTARRPLWELVDTDKRLRASRAVTTEDRREANAALWKVLHIGKARK